MIKLRGWATIAAIGALVAVPAFAQNVEAPGGSGQSQSAKNSSMAATADGNTKATTGNNNPGNGQSAANSAAKATLKETKNGNHY